MLINNPRKKPPQHSQTKQQGDFRTKQLNILDWPSQSPDFNPSEHVFYKNPQNNQELNLAAVQAWQKIITEATVSGDVNGSHTPDSH